MRLRAGSDLSRMVLTAVAVAVAVPAFAQTPKPAPTVRAHRVTQPIRIDGRLDEEVYKITPAITGFVQQEPDEFQPATEKTEAWIFFDDDNVYVSARNFETHPERRVANEMRRDTGQLRQNDTFGVMFDTFHDKRNGYIFYANAIGGLADSQVTDEGPPNADWNTVWDVRTGEFDGGWTIEIVIPFKSLRYQPGTDQTWGVNLRRVVRWKNEWSYLAQVPRALTTFRGFLKISSAGTLEGLQVPSGSTNLELKPFALGGVSTDNTVTPIVSNDSYGRVGGDAKYGITQSITADLTVNTDFAQVEVDEQQVNLTRFNLFFPEKRDFFLEGLGTFAFAGRASAGLAAGSGDTPYLFFSRRIGLDQSRVIPTSCGRPRHRQGRPVYLRRHQRPDRRRRGGANRIRELHGGARQDATSCAAAVSAACSRIAPRHQDALAPTTALASTRRCRSTRTSASMRISRGRRRKAAKATTSATAGSSITSATCTAFRPSAWSSSRTSCRRSASSGAPICGATSRWPASARGRATFRIYAASQPKPASTT